MMRSRIRSVLWGMIILCCGFLVWNLLQLLPVQATVNQQTEEIRSVRLLICQESQTAQKAWEHTCERFAADHANLRLEVEFVPSEYLQREISMEEDENRLPNLLVCDYAILPAYASMKVAREMDLDIRRIVEEQTTEPAKESVLVDGKCYGFPLTCDPFVLFYNQSFYEKNGVEFTTDTEAFIQQLRTIRSIGNYNLGFAAKDASDLCALFLHTLTRSGGSIHALDSAVGTSLCAGLALMRDDSTLPRDVVLWNQDDLMKAFEDGMVINAAARLSCLKGLNGAKLPFGVCDLPLSDENAGLFCGDCIAMVKPDTDTRETLRWLTREENVSAFCQDEGYLSVFENDTEKPGKKYGLSDEFLLRYRTSSECYPSYGTWFLISDTIGEEMASFLSTLYADGTREASLLQKEVRDAILKR